MYNNNTHNYCFASKKYPMYAGAFETWGSHANLECCFKGSLTLNEGYYVSSVNNYKTLITDILPVICNSEEINLILSCDKEINRPLIEYIHLLDAKCAKLVCAGDLKTVNNLKKLPVALYEEKGTFFDLRWLLRLRGLVTIPSNFKKLAIQRKRDRHLPVEVVKFLRDNNFTFFILEDIPIQEQINLFAGAEQIVAVHGAGISNSAFCKTGCKILEISCGFNMHYYTTYINEITQLLPDVSIDHSVVHNYNAIPEFVLNTESERQRKLKYRNDMPVVDIQQFIAAYHNLFG